jgi:hypothetical protein
MSINASAEECALTVTTQTNEKIETAFQTKNNTECRELALKTKENQFFGLLEKDSEVIELKYLFKDENGPIKEVFSFGPSDNEDSI